MISEAAAPSLLTEMLFRLDSLRQTAAPAGCDGVWYRYVIMQGTGSNSNTIEGVRAGTLVEVTSVVDAMLVQLNLRFAKRTPHPRLRVRKR
jgi:hypothetical protein